MSFRNMGITQNGGAMPIVSGTAHPALFLVPLVPLWYTRLRILFPQKETRLPSAVSMKALLEAGVHFGHQTRRWNPKMKKFIFVERNGIHIIDLQKTLKALGDARAILSAVAAKGGIVL